MSGRSFKRQRTRFGAGGYAVPVARSLTYDIPSFKRKFPMSARFAGARYVNGRYIRGSSRPSFSRAARSELQGMDTALTQTTVVATTSTNGNAVCLNMVGTGSGSFNRYGRKITLKSVRLTGLASYLVQTAAATYDTILSPLRMVVVWDKQSSGAAIPAWDVVFGNTDNAGTETSSVASALRYDNLGRFSIIKDVTLRAPAVLPSDGAAAAQISTSVPFDMFIPLNDRVTQFSTDTTPAVVTDISTGALYIYFRTVLSSGTEYAWTVSSASFARLRFTS